MSSEPKTFAAFPPTCWDEFELARQDPERLSRLVEQYWSPIYAYLRRTGRPRDQALDLTQGFVAAVALGRGLFVKVNPDREQSFRAYLIAAIKYYVCDEHRREGSRRPPEWMRPIPSELLDAVEPGGSLTPEEAFEQRLAINAVETAIDKTREHYRLQGNPGYWDLYETRVARGAVATNAMLAERFRIESAERVSMVLQNVKRTFEGYFIAAVARDLPPGACARTEAERVRTLLQNG